jgi:AcrR family transcriptional regulator
MAQQKHVRKQQESSEAVVSEILKAAASEFASHGFEGASTRAIAERAGVFQAQISYHIGTKDDLWRSTIDWLFKRLRNDLEQGFADQMDEPFDDASNAFADIIRRHVKHTAQHPELSRIMSVEAAMPTERTKYLLNNHVKPTLAALRLIWADVQAQGRGRGLEADDVFMLMIGLAPLPFAQGPLMKSLVGKDRCHADAHADAMVKLVLG